MEGIESGEKSYVNYRQKRNKFCSSLKNINNNIEQDKPVRRTTSSMWDTEFDPFQVFEVDHEACLHLEITIHKGENVSKGFWNDLIDTPDPYVVLRIPGSSNSSKRTSHVDNTVTPIWEETFHFYIDPNKLNHSLAEPNRMELQLYVSLWDANYTMDEAMGEESLPLSSLAENEKKDHVFTYLNGSKVYTTILLQKDKNPDLRFSLSLCEQEKAFLRLRREKVKIAMGELLGQDLGPKNKNEVPIVAVLGSGGGFRAMICLSGVIRALHKSGILNCATFLSGLSGSSWLISTLYAHNKFPNLTYDEIYEELKESVTSGWKWHLLHFHRYAHDMIAKYRRGQPVSFTDFFGHLLGDVLLKGEKQKKLSDQQKIVSQGIVPFPLYTCLHAKASVSCKSFSEWVEFSPFEIGIAKYGTFMRTQDFGNKFIVGKLIKKFPEFPLHYLQGVWGSAFTILVKRMMGGKNSSDMVQMMRDANEERAINEQLEQLEEECLEAETESDTDDEKDIEGRDDSKGSSDEEPTHSGDDAKNDKTKSGEKEGGNGERHRKLSRQAAAQAPSPCQQETLKDTKPKSIVTSICKKFVPKSKAEEDKKNGRKISSDDKIETENERKISLENSIKDDKSFNITFKSKKKSKEFGKIVSFDSKNSKKEPVKEQKSKSLDQSSDMEKTLFPFHFINKKEEDRKISTQSDPGQPQVTNAEMRRRRLQRQGGFRNQSTTATESVSANRWQQRRLQRQTQRENKGTFIKYLLENSNMLNSRAGRAGEILNPFRGLSLKNSFPLSPFPDSSSDDSDDLNTTKLELQCRYEPLDNNAKKLLIVDSGLAFNSPYPLLLRPQRAVDIYLSFDFSQRPSDSAMPFKELLIAEDWARQNGVRFPPIEKLAEEYSKDTEVKEVYVFENVDDPFCPVILHFPLVNNKFKWYKEPGMYRETKEELEFADFPIFDDTNQSFASTNFIYTEEQYNRLVKLTEFNTLYCIDTIKENFKKIIEKKREYNKNAFATAINKVKSTLKAAKMFQPKTGLQIKVNTNEGNKLITQFQRPKLMQSMSDSGNSTAGSEYEDALESFDETSEFYLP